MKKHLVAAIVLGIALTSVDCYSYLEKSNEVDRFFLERKIYPDHTNYYSGSDARPDAIIGIHNDYILKSKLWKSADIKPNLLKNWVNNMTNNSTVTPDVWGKKIRGPNREYLVVWFSPAVAASINVVGNKISITTPR